MWKSGWPLFLGRLELNREHQAFFSRVSTRGQGRGTYLWARPWDMDIWILCFIMHHLTFFKVTNSFSAQGRRDSSSSYLWGGGASL